MKRSTGRQRCFTSWKITTKLCALALCVAAQSINQCSAQTMSIWTGASCAATAVGDCEWGTDDNWAPPPPDPAPHAPTKPPNDGTANIVFNGPVGLTPLLAGDWNVNIILFDVSAGAFVNAGAPNTLTIQNGITNNSLNPQTFVSTRISLGAPQTWAANQSNLLFKTGSTVANNGHTLTITGNSLTAIEYPMTGTGALVKNGTGTLELGANAAFNNNTVGPITINSGTVTIKGTQCVKKTPGVTLNGGILSLARPNSIGSAAATMTFNGGRLVANSQSDRYGTLILSANSVIDLDAVGGPSTLTFSGG